MSGGAEPPHPPAPQEEDRRGVEEWSLRRVVAALIVVYVVTFFALAAAGEPDVGMLCDRADGAAGADVCTPLERGSRPGGDTAETSAFVRVVPAFDERLTWWIASSALMTLTLGLGLVALAWRERLWSRFTRSSRVPRNVAVPLVFAIAWVAVALLAAARQGGGGWLVAIITLLTALSYFAAVPSFASLLDLGDAVSEEWDVVGDAADRGIPELRNDLRRFVGILGLQIAAWLVWYGATLRLLEALRSADLARQGGVFHGSLDGTTVLLATGGALTGVLAVVFGKIASGLDGKARRLVDGRVPVGPLDSGFQDRRQLREAYESHLGVVRSQRARFESMVAVAGPLLGAIISQFVG